MKKRWIFFPLMLLVLITCTEKQQEDWEKRVNKITGEEKADPDSNEIEKIMPDETALRFLKLEVAEVHFQQLLDAVEAPGVLRPRPNAQTMIKAPLQGWIKNLPVEPGSTVQQKDLLILIENPNNLGQHLKIISPMAGMITDRWITPSSWVESGEPLLRIVDYSRLRAMIKVYPDDQSRVKIGQQVEIFQNDRKSSGTIFYLSPKVDPETGTIEARADIDNPDHLFKTNAPAIARIVVGKKIGLAIPVSSLLHEEDHFIVFVQTGKEFEKRFVRTGIQTGQMIEIIDGIKDSEKIVVSGAYQLRNIAFSSTLQEEE